MNSFIFGVLLTSVLQVGEVIDRSNAIAFIPNDYNEVTAYLNEIDNRAVPVIVINDFYRDQDGRLVYHEGAYLKQALAASSHYSRLMFMWDEPLMHAVRVGQSRDEVLEIMRKVKADFPGVEFAHIEAFTDLYDQYMENYGELKLMYSADLIGFNCYGPFDSCGGFGVPELPQMVYLTTIQQQIDANNSKAKLFLIPGAFKHPGHMTDESIINQQLYDYLLAYEKNSEYVGGVGFFAWGSNVPFVEGIIGARDIPSVKQTVEHLLDWLSFPESYSIY